MVRIDNRGLKDPRKVIITPGYQVFAEGSALIDMGQTRVICAASVEESVPHFLKGSGTGWVTAEYNMLPRSTLTRIPRETSSGRPNGRSLEIQRLIGRSLRAVTNLKAFGERSVKIDCDVLHADGGTRTAAITGSYVALYQAFWNMLNKGQISSIPFTKAVAAISVGILNKELLLDVCYKEDSEAEADFNIVMTDSNEFVEVQGTAESNPFSLELLHGVLELAQQGCDYLFKAQQKALETL